MKTIMMNMVRIFNGSKVLVLDKKKKYGWEGLTFPGGKVEPFESFNNSAIREIKEETNLDIKDLEFNGFIQWYCKNPDERYVGLLYTAHGFDGKLISENIEGNLFFEDYEEFK
ncbi:NUDIX domain-containing protein, partial [Helcococcus ovis]